MVDPRIAYFDSLADGWEAEEPRRGDMIARVELQRGLLGLSAGQDVLEVGCGTGKLTGWLVEQVAPGRVMGIDFSTRMIEQARRTGADAEFACRDVCDGGLGTARFDTIFCFHCFPHFRDSQTALDHLTAAMKPQGRFLVMHLAGSRQLNAFHAALEGPVAADRLPEGEEWNPLLRRAGLREEQRIDREDLFFLRAVRA